MKFSILENKDEILFEKKEKIDPILMKIISKKFPIILKNGEIKLLIFSAILVRNKSDFSSIFENKWRIGILNDEKEKVFGVGSNSLFSSAILTGKRTLFIDCENAFIIFSIDDTDGIRTYIFDADENYVIVLAPYRNRLEYYLLTAYLLEGRNVKKIKNKYDRRLQELY